MATGRPTRRPSPNRARSRVLPPGSLRVAYDVVVADTANHLLRGVRLSDGAVVATIDLSVGLADARTITGAVPAVLSPWDVVWWPALDRLVVACAGVHLLVRSLRRRRAGCGRDPGRHHGRGTQGRAGARWLAGATVRAGGRRRPALVRRRRDVVAAHAVGRRPAAHLRRRRVCSTSASSTGRPRRPGCSTRSGSPCSPTVRSRSPTPTTARSAATTRRPTRCRRSRRDLDEPSGLVVVDGASCSWSSRARTASCGDRRAGGRRRAGGPTRRWRRPVRSPTSRPGRSSSRWSSPCRPGASSTRARARPPGCRSARRRRRC